METYHSVDDPGKIIYYRKKISAFAAGQIVHIDAELEQLREQALFFWDSRMRAKTERNIRNGEIDYTIFCGRGDNGI